MQSGCPPGLSLLQGASDHPHRHQARKCDVVRPPQRPHMGAASLGQRSREGKQAVIIREAYELMSWGVQGLMVQ